MKVYVTCVVACAVGLIVASVATVPLSGQSAKGPVGQTVAVATPPSGADAKRFVGTWRLVSVTQETGRPDPNRGPHPTGMIIYDASGRMAVQIMPDRAQRRAFAGAEPTPEEARAALRGYTAYFGTYRIDERARTVTHNREGNINPGALGDFVRRYEFLPGDRVALMPIENQNRLIWERVK